MTLRTATLLLLPLTLCAHYAVAAEDDAAPPAPPSFAEAGDVFDGDLLKLYVTVDGFKAVGTEVKHCAPKGAVLTVTREQDDVLSVRFKKIPRMGTGKDGLFTMEETPSEAAIVACTAVVDDHTQYEIARSELTRYSFRRSGVAFGALVVPFKFYLSGDRQITTSSTIAPYIGFRGPAPFGLGLTPIVSAGLGLVPVTDPNSGETATKSALSAAIGLVLTSSKNDAFNAGILIGRDFLSRADEAADPNVRKAWFSLYVGYKL